MNPLNAAFRFLLELAALAALAYWGRTQHEGLLGLVLAVGLPALAAVGWATFRVPGDSGSSGAPVAVAGPVRLILELALFMAASYVLYAADAIIAAGLLALAVIVHYLLSIKRIRWLLTQL